jgi:Ion channel
MRTMAPPTQPCAARGVLPLDRGARAVALGREVLRRCWRSADNYTLVLVLIVLAILVTAATEGRPPARIGALLLLGGGLVFALHTSRTAPGLEGLAALAVAAALALAVLSIVATGHLALASRFDRPVAVALVVTTPVVIGRRLLQHATVTRATISGALCVYLLIGLAFASLFGATEVVGLGPFFAGQDATNDADFLYFSFATLATVGYGDLVARSNLGRMLAVTEALLGQMYLVTVVALLVGNLGRHRRDRDPARDP